MLKILIILLLITTSSYAQNIVVETYCFSSENQAKQAMGSSKYLMLPSDRIEPKGECFSLFTTEARSELIRKYLQNSYPQMSVTYSSTERSAKEMCDLKVEKIKKIDSFQSKAQIQAMGGISIGQSNSDTKEISQIKVLSGADFDLQVDEQKISGKCRYINSTKYEIAFSMQFIPRPIVPPAPEGTIVIIQNPPPMEVQQGTSLSTTVQISHGERVEVGSIVKDLMDKGVEASLVPKLSFEKQDRKSEEKIYLQID